MWVLDVIHATSGAVETSFHLIAGEWSLGRKKCHFNFHADSSISRTHAVLRVGALSLEQLRDPQSRPAFVLVDQNSRFGSFVNQEQCFGERALRHGDQITFGAKRTVLRVRYQVFVLVASRIQRASRARVNDTCQRIGMHLIASESPEATHCIMEPGKIVATVKVLWALVYNQPVVTTPWIYAILERKSMSEPLPRCENFMPMDENMPAVTSNYLPNPMRKTMFHNHVVVFLAPQSMEELVSAMDGIVIAAYKDADNDERLLREIEQQAQSRLVLIVEPLQSSGFSSGAASSDVRDHAGSTYNASVERRVDLFRTIGASFTSIQELAASVIFVKPPASSTECSFSSSLAGFASTPAPIMSFPEHLSLNLPKEEESDAEEMRDEKPSDQPSDAPETSSRVQDDEATWTPQPLVGSKARRPVLPSSEIVDESLQIKDEASIPVTPQRLLVPVRLKVEAIPVDHPKPKPLQLPVSRAKIASPPPSPTHSTSGLDEWRDAVHEPVKKAVSSGQWKSSRDLVQRPIKYDENDYDVDAIDTEVVRPLVKTCKLVVKKPRGRQSSDETADCGPNFKRFKKGNGYAERSMASLFPQKTVVSVTVDNATRLAFHRNMEVVEEQERIAEELFAMVEKRTGRKR